MVKNENDKWVPEIMYEETDGGLTSHIPFVAVPSGEEMPKMFFIFESRETGEFEPGPDGEELPVAELDLHQYADMAALKAGLTWVEYDNVRFALGLESLRTAAVKGSKITSNVRLTLNKESVDDVLDNTVGNIKEKTTKLTSHGFVHLEEDQDP